MKFVLMVPLRRCGSNAIRLRMNLHPDFYSPYPLHLCDFHKPIIKEEDDLEYFQTVVDLVGLQKHSLVQWDIVFDPIDIFNRIKDKPRSIYQIYWEMLSKIGKKNNAKVIMDKCQDSVCDFEEMVRLFPNIVFLDVVRDPRAQISSMNDAIIYDFDTCLNTIRWVQSREWCDKITEKYPDKIHTIRFEDFIMDQEGTLRSVCRFLDIPFDPIILNVEKSNEAYQMSKTSPLWETNYSNPLPSYIDKYTKKLSIKEIEHIESMTRKWMEKYHYQAMTRHQTCLTKSMPTIHEEKKQQAWKDLKKKYPHDYILRKARARYLDCISQEICKKNL